MFLDDAWLREKQVSKEVGTSKRNEVHVIRLAPNEDLIDSIFRYVRLVNITSASIVSVVGSLVQSNIRYANQPNGTISTGHFEIVSLVGNLDFFDTENSGECVLSNLTVLVLS